MSILVLRRRLFERDGFDDMTLMNNDRKLSGRQWPLIDM
jgi:hypothetical protein